MDPAPLDAVEGPSDAESPAGALDAVEGPSDAESSAGDLDAVLAIPRRAPVRRKSSGTLDLDDTTALRAMLGKPCGCKIAGGCFAQFKGNSAFAELRRFREELKSLHKLDQDRVDTQQ